MRQSELFGFVSVRLGVKWERIERKDAAMSLNEFAVIALGTISTLYKFPVMPGCLFVPVFSEMPGFGGRISH